MDLEAAVAGNPTVGDPVPDGLSSSVDEARNQVNQVAGDENGPIIGLNAQPVNLGLPGESPQLPADQAPAQQQPVEGPPGYPPPLITSFDNNQPPQPPNPLG